MDLARPVMHRRAAAHLGWMTGVDDDRGCRALRGESDGGSDEREGQYGVTESGWHVAIQNASPPSPGKPVIRYSDRSATTGSTRVALMAGMMLATNAAAPRTPATSANTVGSLG